MKCLVGTLVAIGMWFHPIAAKAESYRISIQERTAQSLAPDAPDHVRVIDLAGPVGAVRVVKAAGPMTLYWHITVESLPELGKSYRPGLRKLTVSVSRGGLFFGPLTAASAISGNTGGVGLSAVRRIPGCGPAVTNCSSAVTPGVGLKAGETTALNISFVTLSNVRVPVTIYYVVPAGQPIPVPVGSVTLQNSRIQFAWPKNHAAGGTYDIVGQWLEQGSVKPTPGATEFALSGTYAPKGTCGNTPYCTALQDKNGWNVGPLKSGSWDVTVYSIGLDGSVNILTYGCKLPFGEGLGQGMVVNIVNDQNLGTHSCR